MNPLTIARSNRALGAPSNWDSSQGLCGSLPIRDDIEAGARVMKSAWEPSATELKMLNAGCPVILTLFTTVHPATSIGVGSKVDAE
jgi:hypothetical protein